MARGPRLCPRAGPGTAFGFGAGFAREVEPPGALSAVDPGAGFRFRMFPLAVDFLCPLSLLFFLASLMVVSVGEG